MKNTVLKAPVLKIPVSISSIPEKPGVYLMRGEDRSILYIGKAKNMKKRVSSYFHRTLQSSKTKTLVQHISSVETFITDNEVEALILESNLIKQYKPRYNIELKENESYPYIKITRETFPRIIKTRTRVDDGALYFGPYTNASYVNRTIRTITEIFQIRRCSKNLDKQKPSTPCINYYLGKCMCPCCDEISEQEYGALIDQVVLFLKGQNQKLVSRIKRQMEYEAKNRRYEQAMQSRDRLHALEHLLEEQKMTTEAGENEDFIGIAKGDTMYADAVSADTATATTSSETLATATTAYTVNTCTVTILVKRNGKMTGKQDYTVKQGDSLPQMLEQFLSLHYDGSTPAPQTIFLPFKIPDIQVINRYLQKTYNRSIRTAVPQKGIKKRLVDLACRNAEQKNREELRPPETDAVLQKLKNILRLQISPHCIEAFDIATTLGNYSVAAMVRFTAGAPDRKQYRRFRIKFTPEQNDVEMMREAVARRYQRLINENKPLPNLILVDGGTPQVNGARNVLDALGIHDIPVVGLAKRHEDIYLNGRKKPIRLEKSDPALKLLMSMRNEVHRYATTYHITVRAKEMLVSRLTETPGIGDSLVSAILSIIGKGNIPVTIDILKNVRGIGPKKAARVFHVLRESGIVPFEERQT